MSTTVDELLTIYTARDMHTPVAKQVAQVQMQVGRGIVDTTRLRQQGERVLQQEARTLTQSLKLQAQVAKTSREESNERAAAARAITAETRARDALAKSLEREERATRQVGAARKFAQGFGSTRLNFGAASPLVSSFTRGGLAGGAGALTATALGGIMSGGSALMGSLGNMLRGGVQGGLGMLGDLATRAQDAAISASSRQGRLTAILRDSQMAAQVLKTVQSVAAPSTATTSQLADAATTLEAFGVNANRSIPIIGKLATAMGAGEEQMQMYSRAIGQLGTGNMIDADVMAAMGLQRRDFAAQGIQFDGNGKLLSSAEQALTALERIVNDRFGNIFEQMANTPEAKRASLEDAGERALAIIGDGMLKTQGPLVDALTKTLNAAVDSGVLSEVVSRATGDVFKALDLGNQGDMVTGIMARVLAFVEVVPGNLAKGIAFLKDGTIAAINNVSEFFKQTEDRAERFMARISLLMTQGRMLTEGIGKALESPLPAAPGILARTFRDMGQLSSVAETMMGQRPEYQAKYKDLPSMPSFSGIDAGRVGQIEARLRASMASPGGGIPDASGQAFLRRGMAQAATSKPVDESLAQIAENTGRTAKNTEGLDLREAIFGGGAKARRGLSFADIAGSPVRGGGSITIKGDKAADKIKQALYDIIEETMPDILDAATRKMAFQ